MVGLWGGQLAMQMDGWEVTIESRDRIDMVRVGHDSDAPVQMLYKCITQIQAVGFSPSGIFLVVATSSDLALFTRTG